MALDTWWLIPVVAAVGVLSVVVGWLLGRRQARGSAADGALLARAERVRRLASFGAAVRRRQLVLSTVLIAGVLIVALAGVIAARPMASETVRPTTASRDIMLCLDVSGSMVDVDREVIDVYLDMMKGFKGERVGMTIFNSSPVQVFPLTDDYSFAEERLKSVRDGFDSIDSMPEHWIGTLNGFGASLIGDGLAACTMAFDNVETKRSRTIVLATDNEARGSSVVSLDEAADYATGLGARVFAINPVAAKGGADAQGLETAVKKTGGEVFDLRGTESVETVIREVRSQEAQEIQGQAQVLWTDAPNLWIVLFVVLSLGLTALVWRVRA